MPCIDAINMTAADPRVRRTVYPTRLVGTFGQVDNAETLLREKTLQILLTENDLVTLTNTDGERASILLDFGRELHGAVRLLGFSVKGEATHASVRLTFGESVAEAMSDIGEKNATNDHTARDMVVTVPAYSDQEFAETGFRFLHIQLLDDNTELTLKAVTATFIYRDLPYLGSFSCSNPRLNAIYDTAAYTCHLNMQKQLWDGIKRDRLLWVGDMHPEMLTIRTVFGACGVMEDAIRFARETTPLPAWMNTFATYSLWWLCMVWDWYEYSGDPAFLGEHSEYALDLAKQVMGYVDEDGSYRLPGCFVDWPTCGKPESIDGTRALLVLALTAAGNIAMVAGEDKVATACREACANLAKAPTCHHGAKQVAALLSLAGLAEETAMADTILEGGAKGLSTFMSYYILKAAAKKSVPAALKLLEEYYGGMLDMGATTFWEDFNIDWLGNASPIDDFVPEDRADIHGDNGAFCYQGFRHSLCHGWSSAPTAFLAEEVLGIHIAEPGCRTIRLTPCLGDLEWAEGTYPTPYGVMSVSCRRREDGGVAVSYEAPDGVTVVCEDSL